MEDENEIMQLFIKIMQKHENLFFLSNDLWKWIMQSFIQIIRKSIKNYSSGVMAEEKKTLISSVFILKAENELIL